LKILAITKDVANSILNAIIKDILDETKNIIVG
jgi:hypothetical protein